MSDQRHNTVVKAVTGSTIHPFAIHASPEWILIGGKHAKRINFDTGACENLPGDQHEAFCGCAIPGGSGHLAAVGEAGGFVSIYDVGKGVLVDHFAVPFAGSRAVECIVSLPAGYIAAAVNTGVDSIAVINLKTKEVKVKMGRQKRIVKMLSLPGWKLDCKTGLIDKYLKGGHHDHPRFACPFHRFVLTGSYGGEIACWDASQNYGLVRTIEKGVVSRATALFGLPSGMIVVGDCRDVVVLDSILGSGCVPLVKISGNEWISRLYQSSFSGFSIMAVCDGNASNPYLQLRYYKPSEELMQPGFVPDDVPIVAAAEDPAAQGGGAPVDADARGQELEAENAAIKAKNAQLKAELAKLNARVSSLEAEVRVLQEAADPFA